MKEIISVIKSKEWKDYKNEFLGLLGNAITLAAQDNEEELEPVLSEITLLITMYRYSRKNADNIDIKTEKVSEEEFNKEYIQNEIVEKIYTGDDIRNVLSNEFKEKQIKNTLIPVKEVPMYTFKIYDGTKYSIPTEEIINTAQIKIPSTNGYDYYMKVTVAENNTLYTEQLEFQKEYAYIKAAYIRNVADPDEDKTVINQKLDGLIDVSLLESEGKIVQWINNRFVSSARPKNEEQIRLEGSRQSMLDNRNIRFMYDTDSDIYHDKSCNRIKLIDLKKLKGSENPPAGKTPCEDCLLDMYIRKGCIDDFKSQTLYRHFFTKGDVSLETIKEFLVLPNSSFRIESVSKLKMTCKEDTWKIETDGRGNFLKLWHNNYFVDKRGKRHVDTTEYHEQNTETIMNVQMAIQYIMDYSYQKIHT